MITSEKKKNNSIIFLLLLYLLCIFKRATIFGQTQQQIQQQERGIPPYTIHSGTDQSNMAFNDIINIIIKQITHSGTDNCFMLFNDSFNAFPKTTIIHDGSDTSIMLFNDMINTANVHSGIENAGLSTYSKTLTAMENPSGFDPFDPEWTPPCGWTVVYDFSSQDQLNTAFTGLSGYEVVKDGIVTTTPPNGEEGGPARIIENISWTRIAIVVKYTINKTNYGVGGAFWIRSVPIPNQLASVSSDFPKGSNVHNIRFLLNQTYYDFTLPDDWFLVVLDNTIGKKPYVKIYDRNKNVIFQHEIEPMTVDYVEELISLLSDNGDFLGIWSYQLDWFALYYGCPNPATIHYGIELSQMTFNDVVAKPQ